MRLDLGGVAGRVGTSVLLHVGEQELVVPRPLRTIDAASGSGNELRILAAEWSQLQDEHQLVPITKISEKPVMPINLMLLLLRAIESLGDLCLMLVGIFSGPRASEAMGFQWKSWTGLSPMPYGIAVEGQLYEGRFKPRRVEPPLQFPNPFVRVIEAWRRICPDPSPDALMFPTVGRGKRKGQAVPQHAKNFLNWRVRPIARRFGIPDYLVTFQVMRRSLGTHLSSHGTLKDAQGALRHASLTTVGNVYVADRRRERDACGQLSRHNGTRGVDAASRRHGSDGPEHQAP